MRIGLLIGIVFLFGGLSAPRGRSLAVSFASKAEAREARGTISGEIRAAPGVDLRNTIVYVKESAETHEPRKLKLDGSRPLVGAIGDQLELGADVVELRPVVPASAPLDIVKRDGKRLVTFTREGIYVRLSGANQEAKAYLFIGQNPYSAAVDEHGRFVIADVPPGDYELAVWNPWSRISDQHVRVQPGSVTINFILQR